MARRSAHAKLNLHLAVLAREETGYHQIETVFCALDLADDIEIIAGGGGIELEVEGAELGPAERNHAYRAAVAFFEEARLPASARIRVHKRIPVGAGLGGGSTDAAASLLVLDELHGYPLGAARLRQIGHAIGSDVPFFMTGWPYALAWGRGERLLALQSPATSPVLLVLPPTAVSTPEAYDALATQRHARLEPAPPRLLGLDELRSFETVASFAQNDFETIIFQRLPELPQIHELLCGAGAIHARLTGSGSALFGIFRSTSALESAADLVRRDFPQVGTIMTATCAHL